MKTQRINAHRREALMKQQRAGEDGFLPRIGKRRLELRRENRNGSERQNTCDREEAKMGAHVGKRAINGSSASRKGTEALSAGMSKCKLEFR